MSLYGPAASQSNQLSRYKAAAISTASPGGLILLLFDGALQQIGKALHGFTLEVQSRRYEEIHNGVLKAREILRELQGCLDLTVEGDFPAQMYGLYEFMIDELMRGNMTKTEEPLRTVETMLFEIRDAWELMLQKNSESGA